MSSSSDSWPNTASGKAILYVSRKSWGRAWVHSPLLYFDRSSRSLSCSSGLNGLTAEELGGEPAALETAVGILGAKPGLREGLQRLAEAVEAGSLTGELSAEVGENR